MKMNLAQATVIKEAIIASHKDRLEPGEVAGIGDVYEEVGGYVTVSREVYDLIRSQGLTADSLMKIGVLNYTLRGEQTDKELEASHEGILKLDPSRPGFFQGAPGDVVFTTAKITEIKDQARFFRLIDAARIEINGHEFDKYCATLEPQPDRVASK